MQDGGKHMKDWQTCSIPKTKYWILVWLLGLTLIVALASLLFGSVKVSPNQVLKALLGRDTSSTAARIVLYSRLPRTCASLLAGAALAVSGTVIQTVLHNPLSSPGVIGINASAGLAVAVVCGFAPSMQQYTPWIAFEGALAGTMLVMGMAQKTGASRMTIVLSGIAFSNLCSAGIDMVVTFVPEALNGVTDFRLGGFTGVTMKQLSPAAVFIGVSLLLILGMVQKLDILALGSDTAKSLGLSVGSVRVFLLILASALAGATVSFSGLLNFVGLIVPHIMRRMVGEESLLLLLASAIGGAGFVTACDFIARMVFAPFEIPVGIVLSCVGAPFFLWLLFHKRGGRV